MVVAVILVKYAEKLIEETGDRLFLDCAAATRNLQSPNSSQRGARSCNINQTDGSLDAPSGRAGHTRGSKPPVCLRQFLDTRGHGHGCLLADRAQSHDGRRVDAKETALCFIGVSNHAEQEIV